MQLSLQALHGSLGARTMRLEDMCKKNIVYALVDSSNTHNFLSKQSANKLGYLVQKMGEVKVIVTNREKLQCGGMCKELEIRV